MGPPNPKGTNDTIMTHFSALHHISLLFEKVCGIIVSCAHFLPAENGSNVRNLRNSMSEKKRLITPNYYSSCHFEEHTYLSFELFVSLSTSCITLFAHIFSVQVNRHVGVETILPRNNVKTGKNRSTGEWKIYQAQIMSACFQI